eukprot:jgi/Picre1/27234/NNA_000203.t1
MSFADQNILSILERGGPQKRDFRITPSTWASTTTRRSTHFIQRLRGRNTVVYAHKYFLVAKVYYYRDERRIAEIFTEEKVFFQSRKQEWTSPVRDQQNGEVVFKVKRSTRFKRVLDAFCNKKSWDSAQVRFAYEGQRVQEDMTPDDLGMENNDCIDAFLEQIGGGSCAW